MKLKILYALILIAGAFVVYNQYMIFNVSSGITGAAITVANTIAIDKTTSVKAGSVSPTGIPAVYGNELGISFDDVSPNNPSKADATISKLSAYDNGISLSGDKKQRYINIVSQISCEYCCGAPSIIDSRGNAACGCAHSYSMRGLAKYLLDKHANEYTDDQILEELGKWKTLFFPDVMAQKANVLKQKGIELNYINLASNKYRGIEKGATGGSMVGGC